MNRRMLIKKLINNGWWLERRGKKHDIYTNGINTESIPRHKGKDIKPRLAQDILKRNGIK